MQAPSFIRKIPALENQHLGPYVAHNLDGTAQGPMVEMTPAIVNKIAELTGAVFIDDADLAHILALDTDAAREAFKLERAAA